MIPIFLITFVMLIFVGYKFIKTSIELRRLSLVSSSQVLSASNEAVYGYSIIRSYGKVDNYFQQYSKTVNEFISIFVHEKYTMFWSVIHFNVFFDNIVICWFG